MTSPAPSSRIILSVERAASDLRRAQPVIVEGVGSSSLFVSAGEHAPGAQTISDPTHPVVKLMKLAGLLPQAVVAPVPASAQDFLTVSADAIEHYPMALAETLTKVSEASVPLASAEGESARIIAFRPRFGHEEHLAVIIGSPEKETAPLVRVHSSCVTGDVFGSLRCDCGSQLHKAIAMMKAHGAGVVLYLSQEGRGIGIANKLRAYQLQDGGMDTVEANIALGFAADERDFALAAGMLKQLVITRITLLTNNPVKVTSLAGHGITVVRREPLTTTANPHNQDYLDTKAQKLGHQF